MIKQSNIINIINIIDFYFNFKITFHKLILKKKE